MSTPKILLTGGCGLIGSATARRLNALGHTNILIVDKLGSSPHKWKTLSQLRFADYLEYDEFCGGKGWVTALKDVTTVVHCGAKSATTEQDAAFLMGNNYGFSQWLAEWCEGNNARFVYASSAATYGANAAMEDKDDLTYLESLRPLNAYGMSKSLFDIWMARGDRFGCGGILNRGAGAVGLKYTNVFGPPWEHHKGEQRSLVCKAYDALRAGKPIELFTSPRADIKTEQIARDFIGVDDAAKITVWFALDEVGRKVSGLYNCGSGVATSFTDLARFTAEAFHAIHPDIRIWGTKPNANGNRQMLTAPYITYVPMPEHLRGRYQYVTNPSIAKLRAAGYAEEITPLKDAVREYVGQMAREGDQS